MGTNSLMISFTTGLDRRQGPHHGAEKNTSVGVLHGWKSVVVFVVVVVVVGDDDDDDDGLDCCLLLSLPSLSST